MRSRAAALGAAVLLTLTVPLAFAPVAEAHCNGPGKVIVVDKCTVNDGLEAAVDALNAASDGSIAYVLGKDRRWHPEVVTIKNGGTVVFVHADVFGNEGHDPRSSALCLNGVYPLPNPQACVPGANAGHCFDILDDQGLLLKDYGQRYPVTFRYLPAVPALQKSHGYFTGTPVGDATGAQPFVTCPSGTSYDTPAQAVLPYHCGIHGVPGGTGDTRMRGTIIVEA